VLQHVDLPFGTSLICIARKGADLEEHRG
jgi:hypothetical protein